MRIQACKRPWELCDMWTGITNAEAMWKKCSRRTDLKFNTWLSIIYSICIVIIVSSCTHSHVCISGDGYGGHGGVIVS